MRRSASARLRRCRTGFTAMELLVVVGVILVLVSIFLPYLLSVRESSRRARCVENLRRIGVALSAYANANNGQFPRVRYAVELMPSGYVAFTGPDDPQPFDDNSRVRPNDVTASLWLLVSGGYLNGAPYRPITSVFVCPSADESADPLKNPAASRGNFRSGRNLSYSFCSTFSPVEYVSKADFRKSEFVVMADKNPGVGPYSDVTAPAPNAPALELARANSGNHGGAGQNVLYTTGNVAWVTTPYCGVEGDNIYTVQATEPYSTTRPVEVNWRGLCGPQYGPASLHDSYLVPTASEAEVSQFRLLPTTRESPATTTTAPVMPATTQLAPATTQASPATTQLSPATTQANSSAEPTTGPHN